MWLDTVYFNQIPLAVSGSVEMHWLRALTVFGLGCAIRINGTADTYYKQFSLLLLDRIISFSSFSGGYGAGSS